MKLSELIVHLQDVAGTLSSDPVVQIFDPDAEDWHGVTGIVYGGSDDVIQLYCDEA